MITAIDFLRSWEMTLIHIPLAKYQNDTVPVLFGSGPTHVFSFGFDMAIYFISMKRLDLIIQNIFDCVQSCVFLFYPIALVVVTCFRRDFHQIVSTVHGITSEFLEAANLRNEEEK